MAVDITEVIGTLVHITPNHTHYELADLCAMYSDIVFVETGVGSTTLWSQLLVDHDTRIMMT